MVGFDETLNQLNEVIKNKHGQENKQNIIKNKHKKENKLKIPGFSLGPTLEKIINNNKEEVGKFIWKRPDFEKVTTELGNESPQDFKEGDETIYNAYRLSMLDQDRVKARIYLQNIPGAPLIRAFVDDYKERHKYEMGIVVRNKIPVLQYLTLTYDENNPHPYASSITVTKTLCALRNTLISMGLDIDDLRWSVGKSGILYRENGKVTEDIAGKLISLGLIGNVIWAISTVDPQMCESIDD